MIDRGKRASLGFGNELDDFDPTAWSPERDKDKPRIPPELAKQAAEATGFSSREIKQPEPAATPVPSRQQRRRRTGRNVQFNIKTKPETIEAFVAVADAQGWGFGEAFEIATDLLCRKYKAS